MQIHLYTNYENVQMLREGDICAWTKKHHTPRDIHISIDLNNYSLHEVAEGLFRVSLI